MNIDKKEIEEAVHSAMSRWALSAIAGAVCAFAFVYFMTL